MCVPFIGGLSSVRSRGRRRRRRRTHRRAATHRRTTHRRAASTKTTHWRTSPEAATRRTSTKPAGRPSTAPGRSSTEAPRRPQALGAAGAGRAGKVSFRRAERSAACAGRRVDWHAVTYAISGASVRRSHARTSAATGRAGQLTSTCLCGGAGFR
jgi:hypothetical protein